jgi:hypothetical protein
MKAKLENGSYDYKTVTQVNDKRFPEVNLSNFGEVKLASL